MNALATLATALLALLAAAPVARAGELLVNAPVGTFQGVYAAGKQARSWLGIPYSIQPLGERRWTDPEYPAPHKGVFQADSFGPQCIQHCQLEADSCAAVSSEACLFLNIYAPRAETALPGPWPVALFVHGGMLQPFPPPSLRTAQILTPTENRQFQGGEWRNRQ